MLSAGMEMISSSVTSCYSSGGICSRQGSKTWFSTAGKEVKPRPGSWAVTLALLTSPLKPTLFSHLYLLRLELPSLFGPNLT